ncbi:MAG: helix-turn-helix transcriptional regulator, partial [Spirochaetaceae bacterium]
EKNCDSALSKLSEAALDLVPADRGSALFRVSHGLPWCIRWPEYASTRVPLFNSHYNRVIPIGTGPERPALGPVMWNRYRDTEYVTDFHEPMAIRSSVGAAFTDRFRGTLYTLWLHRSVGRHGFKPEEVLALRFLCARCSGVISLKSELDATKRPAVIDPELGPEASVLTLREVEVVRLVCRGLTMREISTLLHISPRTVERHALHSYRKLNVTGKKALKALMLERLRHSR